MLRTFLYNKIQHAILSSYATPASANGLLAPNGIFLISFFEFRLGLRGNNWNEKFGSLLRLIIIYLTRSFCTLD